MRLLARWSDSACGTDDFAAPVQATMLARLVPADYPFPNDSRVESHEAAATTRVQLVRLEAPLAVATRRRT